MSKIYTDFQAFQRAYQFDPADADSKLGNGTYGQVIQGWDIENSKDVAIKSSFREDDDSVSREYVAASELTHPNIVRYLAYGRLMVPYLGLRDYTVMQYYPDGNLHAFIKKHALAEMQPAHVKNALTEKQTKSLVRGILEGLAYLHGKNRVHRDFKPSNILITWNQSKKEYVPIIADFGSVKTVGKTNSDEFSISDHAKTIAYAAPEQMRGESTAGYNIDLWAFGVVLYEIMTKQHPFSYGLDHMDQTSGRRILVTRIINVELPAALNRIPEPYQQMIRVCLIADRKKRVQRASELLDRLDELSQKLAQAQAVFSQGDFAEAREQFEQILALRPNNTVAKKGIDDCNKVTNADAILQEKIKNALKSAQIALANREFGVARQHYQTVLTLQPGNIVARNGIANCQHELEQQRIRREEPETDKMETPISPTPVVPRALAGLPSWALPAGIVLLVGLVAGAVWYVTNRPAAGVEEGSMNTFPEQVQAAAPPKLNADSLFTATKMAFSEQGLDKTVADSLFEAVVKVKPDLADDVFKIFEAKATRLKAINPIMAQEYDRLAGKYAQPIRSEDAPK